MAVMRCVSLFSGCGGFDFAARAAGIDTVWANDILSCAGETYKRYFSEVDFKLDDIAAVSKFPSAELVIGGYPCQSFSMGGNRNPAKDPRSSLFQHFARAIDVINPKFFVAENVSGLRSVDGGKWLATQFETFSRAGKHGYCISHSVLDARDYGIPQRRRRVFIVGVRRDLQHRYRFPEPTHGPSRAAYISHGSAICHLPYDPRGEYYERPDDPAGNFSWYYLSRNRRAPWSGPSYTIVANARHITLHPASPLMRLVSSDLKNGWRQDWAFSEEYDPDLDLSAFPQLEKPRRLSWREAAALQTFPEKFEPAGNLLQKYLQIGNAVPPRLALTVLKTLVDESGLIPI